MELNWLECLLYGLISGFSEFLPVSSLAHQTLFLKLLGKANDPLLQCCAYVGGLVALLIFCLPTLNRLRREQRIASTPRKRRRRQPDPALIAQLRVLRTGIMAVLVLLLGHSLVANLHQRLWLLALFVAVSGVLLYVPQYMPSANKTALSLSALDAMVIGLAAGCGIVPGVSRVGAAVSVAVLRGTDRRYSMELALLLSIPAVTALAVLSALAAFGSIAAITGALVLRCLLVTASAFAAAYLGIFLARFLAVRAGFGGFAYYCWGFALFTLIIYLI